ncbi:MAG TPA: pitrilysin family protein [Pseudogracilibacillus sp.]|nr:pitrilysin family protein [Pseudogracilibacillus sp.]
MNKIRKISYDHIEETLYEKTLSNGLSVFLLPKPQMTKSFGIFMTNYGSMHNNFTPLGSETKITVPDGIAHFLEHKLFEKEDHDVFSDFMQLGASPNAYTSFSKTAYLFSTTANVHENVETLLDFVQEPYFSDASVEKEKGIIAQEINMYDDEPGWRSFMGAIKNMYAQLPINIDIAGTVESIQDITKEHLYTCYETFYHPNNMALFVVGNFDVNSLGKLIEDNQAAKSFKDAQPLDVSLPSEPAQVVRKTSTINLPVSMPRVTLGIKEDEQELHGEALLRREMIQEMVLDYLFSQSGPFYQVLSEEQLIDDSFNFSATVEEEYNFTLISSQTENPEKLVAKLKQLLNSTKDMKIDEKTYQIMQNKKIGELLRELNSLEEIASQFLHYHFANISYFELIPFVQTITVDEINQYLSNWISDERITTFIVEKGS